MFGTWDGPEIATFWVAIGAGAVALTSLLWQLYYATRVDRARLKVKADEVTVHDGGTFVEVVMLTVTNVGRRATVVNNLLLMPGPRPVMRGPLARLFRKKEPMAPMADQFLPAWNTTLPKRLEPGDAAVLYVPRDEVISMLNEERRRIHAMSSSTTARARWSRNLSLN